MPSDASMARTAVALFLAAAFLIGSVLPVPEGRAATDPTLSYTLTPLAYNNTVRAANATDMLAPRVAVGPDPSGNGSVDVYVVGVDGQPCGDLVAVRSTDGGMSFGAPRRTPACVDGGAVDAVVTANGTVLVITVGPRVYRSFDGGASWTAPAVLGTSAQGGTLARDPVSGSLYAAWNATVNVSRDGGATWSATGTEPPIPASVTQPSIAARGGHVVVAFTDWGTDTPNGPFGNETTGVVVSADGGATWSAVKDLVPHGSAYRVGAPSVAVSTSGVFGVTWASMDFSFVTRTLVSASRDGGSTWSATFPAASDGLIFVAPPFGRSTVFDTDGRLFTAWHGFTMTGAFAISVAGSDVNLTSFNESTFTVRFQTGVYNSTGTENLASDNATRVFVVWEVPAGPDAGVFVRTVTGVASGDVSASGPAPPASAIVTLKSNTTGATVRQVTWSGSSFLLPELPPDTYQVWIDTGNGSALAGAIPVRPWGRTAFTVYAPSGVSTGPPPPVPFPWLLAGTAALGLILLAAAVLALHYTRLTRETVLQRKVRLLLYEYVRDHPGAGFSEIRDALGLQNGAAAYHLGVLEKQGLLHSETKGRRHFFYPTGNASRWKDLPVSELQSSILQTVRTTPGIGVRELSRAIGRGPSSVVYNVKALAREGLLRTDRDGLRVRCYPGDGAPA